MTGQVGPLHGVILRSGGQPVIYRIPGPIFRDGAMEMPVHRGEWPCVAVGRLPWRDEMCSPRSEWR